MKFLQLILSTKDSFLFVACLYQFIGKLPLFVFLSDWVCKSVSLNPPFTILTLSSSPNIRIKLLKPGVLNNFSGTFIAESFLSLSIVLIKFIRQAVTSWCPSNVGCTLSVKYSSWVNNFLSIDLLIKFQQNNNISQIGLLFISLALVYTKNDNNLLITNFFFLGFELLFTNIKN